jgi:methylated-DNA-protein-cysteine methyltransferase-like protein
VPDPRRDPVELPDGAELVLAVVESIPPGRVMSYGAIAEVVRERDGHLASARSVGSVMARWGGAVPWHRVVNSAGRLPPGHEHHARERLEREGVPFRNDHVDMRKAAWNPD